MTQQLPAKNQLRLLETGQDFFPELIQAIEGAQDFIFLETYIFKYDDVGQRVSTALCDAAKRGVKVHVLLDGFGSRTFIRKHANVLNDVQLLVFRRELATFSLKRQRLRRLHRKLSVIDGKIAFVGGINIESDFLAAYPNIPRFDFTVRVEGPLLDPILTSMKKIWTGVASTHLRYRPELSAFRADTTQTGPFTASFLIRDNLGHRRDIEQSYLQAIDGAQRSIILACAYFLPGNRFRKALVNAAKRGVDVILLLEGVSQYPIQYRATQALYGYFLSGGVRIFEYDKTHLHAKVAVVDDFWSTVGSSNIDPLSLMLAREANIVVEDKAFAQDLKSRLIRALEEGSTEYQSHAWQHRNFIVKGINWCAYGILRGIVGLLGFLERKV